MKQAVRNQANNDFEQFHGFLKEMPLKLSTQVSIYVYEQRYKHILFFQNRN